MGLFVWYFGTSRRYPDVEHHTIIMGKVFKELLEDIYDRKILSDDLSLYLHRPAASDCSMAQKAGMRFMCWLLCPTNLPKWTGWKRVNGFVCRCKNNWRTLCCLVLETAWKFRIS